MEGEFLVAWKCSINPIPYSPSEKFRYQQMDNNTERYQEVVWEFP